MKTVTLEEKIYRVLVQRMNLIRLSRLIRRRESTKARLPQKQGGAR